MTTREYLELVVNIDYRINSLKERARLAKAKAEKITANYESIGGSGGTSSKIENGVIESLTYEEEISYILKEYDDFRKLVLSQIHRVDDNISATLLEEKYINGKSWKEVAYIFRNLHDSEYVRKEMHSKALRDFDRFNPQSTRKTPNIPQFPPISPL